MAARDRLTEVVRSVELAKIISSVAEYDREGYTFISPTKAADAVLAAGYTKG